MSLANLIKSKYVSAFYSQYEVIYEGDEGLRSLNIPYTFNKSYLGLLRVAVNGDEISREINKEENVVVLTGRVEKDDIIEIYIDYNDSKNLSEVNTATDLKSESFSRLLGGIAGLITTQNEKSGDEVNKIVGSESLNLLKNKDTLTKVVQQLFQFSSLSFAPYYLIPSISSNRQLLESVFQSILLLDLSKNGLEIVQGEKIQSDTLLVKGPKKGYYGNEYSIFGQKVHDLPGFKSYRSDEPFGVFTNEVDFATSFKQNFKILKEGNSEDIEQFRHTSLAGYSVMTDRNTFQNVARIEVPVDFFSEKLGCFKKFTNPALSLPDLTKPERYFKLNFDSVKGVEHDFEDDIDLDVERFSLSGAKVNNINQLDVAESFPIDQKETAHKLPDIDNGHFKFELKKSDNVNLELETDVPGEDIIEVAKKKFPWIFDFRASFFPLAGVGNQNALFVAVNRSFEKTKGTMSSAPVRHPPNMNRTQIDYNLLNTNVKANFSVNLNTGAFTLPAFPDGESNVVAERAVFSDVFGYFQVVNGVTNPRLTQNSALVWVDLKVDIDNVKLRDTFGIRTLDSENLRAIVFNPNPIVTLMSPSNVYVSTPFEGSIFGGAINFHANFKPYNHYTFKHLFHGRSQKYPSYKLFFEKDAPPSEEALDIVDFEFVNTPNPNMLKVKIPKLDAYRYGSLRLYCENPIFDGERVKEIVFYTDLVSFEEENNFLTFNIAINTASFALQEAIEIKGLITKETPNA